MPIYDDPDLDKAFTYDGVTSFNRVSSYARVSTIEPDAMAGAVNMSLDESGAVTRRGIADAGVPSAGNPIKAFGYLDTAVLQRVLAISNAQAFSYDGTTWSGALGGYTVPTATQSVRIAALVDKLFLATAGSDLYSWDGTTFTNLGVGATHTSVSIVGDGTTTTVQCTAHGYSTGDFINLEGAVPDGFNGTWGIIVVDADHFTYLNPTNATATTQGTIMRGNRANKYSILISHTNRLFGAGLPDVKDKLEASDILDGTNWQALEDSLRVGGGESDPITALCSWTDFNLVVGKRNSIWLINADPSQPESSWDMKRIVPEIGCVVHESMCQVGNDIFWLSREGVRSLEYTLQGLTQGVVPVPISRPIQDVIDRINWSAVDTARARFWNGLYILSVPLDTAMQPDTVLVFNTLTSGWMGTWTGWAATAFISTFFGDEKRLLIGRSDGRAAVWQDYISEQNETSAAFQDFGGDYSSYGDTRGMNCQESVSPKQGFSGEVEFWKSVATATVQVRLDGGDWQPFWEGESQGGTGSVIGDALPYTLNVRTFWRIARDLIGFGSWREIQFRVMASAGGKIRLRSVYLAARLEKFISEAN